MLKYVRVWYGGAAIAADNEINGITFGGVGAGTTVDYCEVAMNVDDGFEFFGGTVNAKHLRAPPYDATAASTISWSPFSSAAAYRRASPFCATAASTISWSPFSSAAANSRA